MENKTLEPQGGSPKVELLFKWIMFTATISCLALLSAFYPVTANVALIVIPSILVLIFSKAVFFEKLKLTTLVVMRVLIVLAALRLFNPQVFVDLILLMLIINILEATFTDLLRYKKIWNAISGFALAIGVIVLKGNWAYDAPFGNYYITYGAVPAITWMYAIAYTIWNWIFVTNEFSPSVALMHVGFLLAPFLGGLFAGEMGMYGGINMWLLLRANSLSIGGWLQIGAKDWFEREFYSERMAKFIDWVHTTPVQVVCMLINVILIGIAIYMSIKAGSIGFTPVPFFLN